MELRIKNKKHIGNVRNKTNTVYFELDGRDFEVDIIYVNTELQRSNYFVESKNNELLWNYIKNNYKVDLNNFKQYLLYKIWKYSHGKGVDYNFYIDIGDIVNIRKEGEIQMSSLENKKEDYPKFLTNLPNIETVISKDAMKILNDDFNNIVNKFIKSKVKEKELIICKYIIERQSRIIINQNKQIKYLKNKCITKDEIKRRIEELKYLVNDFVQTDNSGRFKKENSINYYKIEALKELLENE